MSKQRLLKQIIRIVGPALKAHGLEQHGSMFVKSFAAAQGMIDFQSSDKSTRDTLVFTVNLRDQKRGRDQKRPKKGVGSRFEKTPDPFLVLFGPQVQACTPNSPPQADTMIQYWYEVWADETMSSTPYLLLVMPDEQTPGAVVIRDPKEGLTVVHTAPSYESAKDWLIEDEYTRVEGRMILEA
jgi:hypothetical protein